MLPKCKPTQSADISIEEFAPLPKPAPPHSAPEGHDDSENSDRIEEFTPLHSAPEGHNNSENSDHGNEDYIAKSSHSRSRSRAQRKKVKHLPHHHRLLSL